MLTKQSLTEQGYRVKVRHIREFLGVRRADDDCFMTRGEYNRGRENGELEFDLYGAAFYKHHTGTFNIPKYAQAVCSTGGWTQVEVVTPEGQTLHGKYSFGKRNFHRKHGVAAAIGRALYGKKK